MPEAEAVCAYPVAYADEGPCSVCGRGPRSWYHKSQVYMNGTKPPACAYRGAPVLCGHAEEGHVDHDATGGAVLPFCFYCEPYAHQHAFDSGERVGATT